MKFAGVLLLAGTLSFVLDFSVWEDWYARITLRGLTWYHMPVVQFSPLFMVKEILSSMLLHRP
jgi:hypothetical protein